MKRSPRRKSTPASYAQNCVKACMPHPLLTLTLVILWLLLVNQVSVGHIVLGALLGWLIPFATTRFWPESIHIRHPLTLLHYLWVLIVGIVHGSFHVARLILQGPDRLRPAFVEVPLELRTDLAISLLANTISLTPGTVSVQLSADKRTLTVHALDTDDAEALVAEIKQHYEIPLKKIFEQDIESC
jgi:multicomponent K+:H+ antiporter subunit E